MKFDTKCRVCFSDVRYFNTETILNKYLIEYFVCENCGFLQTEDPFWLDESYKYIVHPEDIGYLDRNIKMVDIVEQIINVELNKDKVYVDYAGGCGVLTRLMRNRGFNFYCIDLVENIFAKGYEFSFPEYMVNKVELITCFEGLEHFIYPLEEIEKMVKFSDNILFSTELIPDVIIDIPNLKDWWYYGLNHGQHIGFYSLKTLKYIAKKYDLNLYSDKKKLHLLTKKGEIKSELFERILG